MAQKRSAFFVSDRTGITAEMLGHSLLTQFEMVSFNEITLPFVDTIEKAHATVAQINEQAAADGARPLLFSTLVNQDISAVVATANALFLDCFEIFILPLEKELGVPASHAVGRSHSANDFANYHHRIDAVNFALAHDDGVSSRDIAEADIILTGVSRCGKTPTSLYLAMQFGVRAANYPLIPEDFERRALPEALHAFKTKLYGLTIAPERLREIRQERRPGSQYADSENCRYEIEQAEQMMKRERIPWINSTTKSIEEIATTILRELRIKRHVY